MKPALAFAFLLLVAGCADQPAPVESTESDPLVDTYTPFKLTADLSGLSENQHAVIRLLVETGALVDDIYWQQAYGDRDGLLQGVTDPKVREYLEINFGPWDRLNDNAPFLPGAGAKPAGSNLYPADITKEEFDAAAARNPELKGLYTMVRRDENGDLKAIPYHEFFAEQTRQIADKLREAARRAEDPDFKHYLTLRADALLSDDYRASDMAWMDMKNNDIDVVIGPIENYEDQLYGYKAAHELYVLLKDQVWSRRLTRYAELLPGLQRGLPVPEPYKTEVPGSDSDLGAYDVLFTAGDANAGSKTIAINLPNDEQVQLEKGTRRLQLKNAMRAKYEKILVPIADVLIAEDQRSLVTFDAFFGTTMFHEVAHGLGIKNTVTGKGSVRTALRDHASSIEEGKADVLGLYMISSLIDQGEYDGDLMEHYVTFVASIFRSIRFGAASAHGRANLVRFNFFAERGAFTRDETTGLYRVDPEKLDAASQALSERILTLQGDGDYDAVAAFVDRYQVTGPTLQADLDRVAAAGIPVDIVYEQGLDVLGL
ncbi:MAG: Zn-dependent hydrolase [Rhodothermales bacterium]